MESRKKIERKIEKLDRVIESGTYAENFGMTLFNTAGEVIDGLSPLFILPSLPIMGALDLIDAAKDETSVPAKIAEYSISGMLFATGTLLSLPQIIIFGGPTATVAGYRTIRDNVNKKRLNKAIAKKEELQNQLKNLNGMEK